MVLCKYISFDILARKLHVTIPKTYIIFMYDFMLVVLFSSANTTASKVSRTRFMHVQTI